MYTTIKKKEKRKSVVYSSYSRVSSAIGTHAKTLGKIIATKSILETKQQSHRSKRKTSARG